MQDSNASSNDIIADNSINSGNNDDTEVSPRWVFGKSVYITSPQAGYTVGREPTIVGYTTNTSTAFTIQGTSGAATVVVASGTSDSSGNFRVVVNSATPLDTGANTLRPYVGTNAGPAVNITVVTSPTSSQMPTVDSPAEGGTITTDKVVIADITPGILAKVNFGVKLSEGVDAQKIPFKITQDRGTPKPYLNVSLFKDEIIIKDGELEKNAEFRIFTNYHLFIKKWKLEVFDKDTKRVVMERSNEIEVNDHKIRLGDSMFKLFLRFVLELKKNKGGWINRHSLGSDSIITDVDKFQIYSNLRTALQGSLLDKDGQKFIENNGSKQYRISLHPDFITYHREMLIKHPDSIIQELAKKLPKK